MVFPIAIAEGPIISVLSGFLVGGGVFNAYIAFIVLLVGDIVGDSIYYAIGYYGGKKVIPKFGHRVKITEEKIALLENRFNKNDWKLLLFAKTQAIGSIILMTSGLVKMSFSRFVFFNTIGSIPKIILFMIIGFYFGRAYLIINTYLGYFALVWLLLAFIILGLYFYIVKYIKEKSFKNI